MIVLSLLLRVVIAVVVVAVVIHSEKETCFPRR